MTVKRLDSNQPETFSFSKKDKELIEKILKNYPKDRKQSAVVPSLYIAQKKSRRLASRESDFKSC